MIVMYSDFPQSPHFCQFMIKLINFQTHLAAIHSILKFTPINEALVHFFN